MNTHSKTESARVAAAAEPTNDADRCAPHRGDAARRRHRLSDLCRARAERRVVGRRRQALHRLRLGHRRAQHRPPPSAHRRGDRASSSNASRTPPTRSCPYESVVALAERLNALTPGNHAKKTAFFTTGAEAVENAIKIARAATRRPGVIAFSGGVPRPHLHGHGADRQGRAVQGRLRPVPGQRLPRAGADRTARRHRSSDSLQAIAQLFKADIEPDAGRGDHRRAGAGRRRLLRDAARVHARAAQDLRRARHRADRRRDPDRLRAHRQDVRDGALRRACPT